jgi:ferredoxin
VIVLLIILCVLAAGAAGLWLFGERWRPMRRSTWRFIRAGGWRRFLNLTTLHGYLYGRWTNQYIKLLTSMPRPSKPSTFISDRYHGKVLTPELAHALITHDHDVPHQDLEQIVPYPIAREMVLKGPPEVAVYECACRHARAEPCRPTQVCMVVGQPFVDFILDHNPRSSRRLTQTEAIELLQAEHKRGHVHSAWFKDAMLGRFYAICNCCKCCCGALAAMMKAGMPMFAASGFVAEVDEAKCKACGLCRDTCPFEAVEVNGSAVVNAEKCMGCGACMGTCPTGAVSLVRDEAKGVPLDVRVLSESAG